MIQYTWWINFSVWGDKKQGIAADEKKAMEDLEQEMKALAKKYERRLVNVKAVTVW